MVAKFRNNLISPLVYPTAIKSVAEKYNQAFCLVEINDIGQQVADILHRDLEYEHVLMTVYKGRSGQQISGGFGGGNTNLGVRTTTPVKKLGCSVLKSLVENDKLIIEDVDTVNEMITFVAKGQSFEADEGHNDDLAMCLVLFGWLTRQDYFKNLTNLDIRTDIYHEEMQRIEEEILPFGYISTEDDTESYIDDNGDKWENLNP